MKKSIIWLLAGICIGVAVTFILVQLINASKSTHGQNDASTDYSSLDMQSTQTVAPEKMIRDTGIQLQNAEVSVKISAEWEGNSEYYAQYDITVTNTGNEPLKNWSVAVEKGDNTKVSQNWNCTVEEDNGYFHIMPAQYNVEIKPGESSTGIGMIVVDNTKERLDRFTVVAAQQFEQGTSKADTKVMKAAAMSPLSVRGTQLVDESGEPVALRGVSTHGIAWYPEYINYDAFKTLKEDWGANVIRLAMYTSEYNGYCTGGDKAYLKQLIDNGVQYATELGLYVIIDWHILSDGNPQTYKTEAVDFFKEMSQKYNTYTNVIYEICNEPNGVKWNSEIKPYADEVVSAIRTNDKDAVVIVGTGTWSQDVTDVIDNKINDDNIMYALHFYAATHTQWLRDRLLQAKNAGIPILVSECSICDASGNGAIDYNSANEWLTLMNDNGISFVAWSLADKAETSALIKPDCQKTSGWSESDLSETGIWFRNAIRN